MILCDTDVIIEFYKNNSQIIHELRIIGQSNIAVSAITQAELYFGALNKAELRKIQKHLKSIRVFPLDNLISRKFISLMESLSLSHKISIPDALVAATALIHSIELYTLNTTDFQFIKNIQLYKPIGFKSE
ncbi:Ribonuclease [Desulfonema limicola]|uniref:Ribonuclease VapC n=1 Tax=Desulfonema limicola TaxID=45656 RepID=A0A975B7E9_9BACT|nr:type II toxin-antitoxin system VapC family toxin [Desulfonema limicola]QTA80221.1 Ribonuclease [Desulfonema limicola]